MCGATCPERSRRSPRPRPLTLEFGCWPIGVSLGREPNAFREAFWEKRALYRRWTPPRGRVARDHTLLVSRNLHELRNHRTHLYRPCRHCAHAVGELSLIHISEPTRLLSISYAVF